MVPSSTAPGESYEFLRSGELYTNPYQHKKFLFEHHVSLKIPNPTPTYPKAHHITRKPLITLLALPEDFYCPAPKAVKVMPQELSKSRKAFSSPSAADRLASAFSFLRCTHAAANSQLLIPLEGGLFCRAEQSADPCLHHGFFFLFFCVFAGERTSVLHRAHARIAAPQQERVVLPAKECYRLSAAAHTSPAADQHLVFLAFFPCLACEIHAAKSPCRARP